jgi:hypothetical protein
MTNNNDRVPWTRTNPPQRSPMSHITTKKESRRNKKPSVAVTYRYMCLPKDTGEILCRQVLLTHLPVSQFVETLNAGALPSIISLLSNMTLVVDCFD